MYIGRATNTKCTTRSVISTNFCNRMSKKHRCWLGRPFYYEIELACKSNLKTELNSTELKVRLFNGLLSTKVGKWSVNQQTCGSAFPERLSDQNVPTVLHI